jgi:hypothetical protein
MNRPERSSATADIRLERRLPTYWRVTIDMPPVNIFGPKHLPLLNDIISASLPADLEIKPEWDALLASLVRPASQSRIRALFDRGFHRAGDVENRLGFYVGQLGG